MIEGKIENSGIGVFPHSFGFFRFTSQIFFSRDTSIKKGEERRGKKKRLRDGGWGGNPSGARDCVVTFSRCFLLLSVFVCTFVA